VSIGEKAIDGSESGDYVEIGAKYNSTTGAYELLTAGSGTTGTTTPDGVLITEDGSYLVNEDGDNISY
jgi:hypothetical protein